MKKDLKNTFMHLWEKYFGNAELPIAFYYSGDTGGAEPAERPTGRSCFICELAKVRSGKSLAFNKENLFCNGAKRYLGFSDKLRPGFEYFLSCGNDDMEGERYKQSPELVLELMKNQVQTAKEGQNIVFKRWDMLTESDEPEVVIFFAKPDVLSGLFTLAGFDRAGNDAVITPFGAGCGSIVHFPYLESLKDDPRAVIGMFDPSARPCVADDILTFAVPMKMFEKMIGYMDESFLITGTWKTIRNRIQKSR